jgi:predicted methyltransferase
MLRLGSVAVVALLLVAVPLLADEVGEVVKYEKAKLTLKVGTKQETVEMKKDRPHLHATDGKRIKMADYPKHLKKGVKLEVERNKDGKVWELTIKE